MLTHAVPRVHTPDVAKRWMAAGWTWLARAAIIAGCGGCGAGVAWPDLGTLVAVPEDGANDAALIVGVEDYPWVPKVPGATKNALDWYAYLVHGRRVPVGQVRLLRDAGAARERVLEAAREVSGLVKPGGKVWVVFIGHGAPTQDSKEGVLVGFDAQQTAASLYARSVKQSELMAALGGKPAVMVVDACFSGRTEGGTLLAGDIQPMLLSKVVSGASVTVLSAGRSDEFAGPLPGLHRPAFSYLVLGALRGWGDANGDGVVTAQEAVDYAGTALMLLPIGRTQTPELVGDGGGQTLARGATEKGPDLWALAGLPGAAPAPSPPTPSASAAPTKAADQPQVTPALAATGGMVQIPGGTFMMGSRNDKVTVRAFWLDVTEVTVDAYVACVRGGRCTDEGLNCSITYSTYGVRGKGNHPINCVDWNQSESYCTWAGKRLPTEEEWEWAASSGKGWAYPWGNDLPDSSKLCWDRLGSKQGTCPVGSYSAGDSAQGVKDLAGNVWEWTSTKYDANDRVIRGGSWYEKAASRVRAADHSRGVPADRFSSNGFRCARSFP